MENLGKPCKDKVSGLKGVIVAKYYHLNGCVQYQIQPNILKGENKIPSTEWIDIKQIVVTGDSIMNAPEESKGAPPSGSPGMH